MSNEVLKEKNDLLENAQTTILATVDKNGNPNSSYAPVFIDQNLNLYIYISELSQHTKNLLENSLVSLMIIEDESKSKSIFARKRLSLNGECKPIKRDTKLWNDKVELMEQRFDETFTYLKQMKDFHLFRINPVSGLLVYGFGKAFNLTGEKLDTIVHLNESGHKTD